MDDMCGDSQDGGVRRISLATGVELAVREYGEGVPVLLLHAVGETHRTFDRLLPLLPATMHLVVPDQREAGTVPSPLSEDGYTLREEAADMIALLDALGHGFPAGVIGTSSGGYLRPRLGP